ncbi:extracellular solute-binding protein [Roseibium sp. CAU 1639]|uniref:Extracellular solute-binding protein n=2 Tax=Roseibium sediminicola TaxID=2933272 RepID=A0ABT0GWC5_9HYPH|nr:ABC transporter substrate-binding protein [Roseibium sp. CAU 1639]MCK7613743.1 extracellular solute-binding protein [Roseibium sp. CAU 1639]
MNQDTMSHRRILTGLLVGTALLAGTCQGALAADGSLTVFDWSGYEEPEFHPAYAAKHGDSPTFTFFADEDEAFAKMTAGFIPDIAHPCSQSVVKWRDAGLLAPLDTSKIEGFDDILPGLKSMKDLVSTADGTVWFLPFDWGNTLMTYNADAVDQKDIQSLTAFADPKFKGRVAMADNVDDAFALASLAIGMKDWTEMDDAKFAEATAFLRKVHPNVRLYWADSTELAQAFGGGEIDLAWAWNETSTTLSAEGLPIKAKKDTDEGLSTWVCGYVKLKGAEADDEKIYDYLSAVNAPEVAKYIVTAWGYGHGNGAGMKAIPQEDLDASGYGDVDQFVDNTLFQSPLPNELKAKMIAEWEKIKAGY